jgi:hypothetical protein
MGFLGFHASPHRYVVEGFGGSTLPVLRKGINSGNGLFEDLQHDIAPVSGHALAQGLTIASFAHIVCAEQVWRLGRYPSSAITLKNDLAQYIKLRQTPQLISPDRALKTEAQTGSTRLKRVRYRSS